MAETHRVLLLGTLDDEGMRRILQVATAAGYEVGHARSEWLTVSGNGADICATRSGRS